MHIIPALQSDSDADPIRSLAFEERRTLIAAMRDDTLSTHPLLPELHRQGQWLVCDCRTDTPPLLHTRRTAQGTLTLVRMHGRAHHAPGCPVGEGLTDHYDADPEHTAALERLLIDAIIDSGIRDLWTLGPPDDGEWPTLKAGVHRLKRSLESASIGRHPLKSRVITTARDLPRLAVSLRRDCTDSSHPPSGLLLEITKDLTRSGPRPLGALDQGQITTVRGPIVRLGASTPDALSLVALHVHRGTDGRYEPAYALSVPISSRGYPTPLPTSGCRTAAGLLRSLASELRSESDLSVGIRAAYPAGLNAPCDLQVISTGKAMPLLTVTATSDPAALERAKTDTSLAVYLTDRDAEACSSASSTARQYRDRFLALCRKRIHAALGRP
ncbi:MAG: hypothetical protein RJQ08_01695 [Salinisphaeraceae bacterium]